MGELLLDLLQFDSIHAVDLRYHEPVITHLEFLLILVEDLLRCTGTHITACAEHVDGKLFDLHTADL